MTITITEQELKPCPLCGKKVDVTETYITGRYIIVCPRCNIFMHTKYENLSVAIKTWNTRASDAELEELRKIEKSPILKITESDLRDYEKKEFEKYYAKFSDLELVVHLMADLLRFGAFKEGEKDPGYLFSCEIQALKIVAKILKNNSEFSCNGWIVNYLDKFGFLK